MADYPDNQQGVVPEQVDPWAISSTQVLTYGDTYTLAGLLGTDLSKLIRLCAGTVGEAGLYETLQTKRNAYGYLDATAYYQVPAGKILYVVRLLFSFQAAAQDLVFGYGDSAVSSTSPPTNAVGLTPRNILTAAVAGAIYAQDPLFQVPASKYPYIYSPSSQGWGVIVFGKEV